MLYNRHIRLLNVTVFVLMGDMTAFTVSLAVGFETDVYLTGTAQSA
jgi:hypothetical protein